MNSLIDKENPKILMKNNVLIRSKYTLTLNENRLFLLILYKLQKDYDGSMSCQIHYDEFKDIIKRKNDRTVKKLSEYLVGLMQKSIFFMDKKRNDKLVWGQYNFISGYQYDEETQTFRVDSPKKIYDLLDQYLKTGYTPANLALLFSLKTYTAQRLYDLLRVWSGTKTTITYTFDELKMYLMLEDSYPQYSNFKRRVIVPAINELNSTGYFKIEFEEVKVGRKVVAINFTVVDYDDRVYFADKPQVFESVEKFNPIVEENNEHYKEDEIEQPKGLIFEAQPNTGDLIIPDIELFSKGTLRSFKKDFKCIDFKNEYMERAFDYAAMATLDRDDVDVIKVNSYKFFKITLENKILEYRKEEEKDLKHKEEMEMNW